MKEQFGDTAQLLGKQLLENKKSFNELLRKSAKALIHNWGWLGVPLLWTFGDV